MKVVQMIVQALSPVLAASYSPSLTAAATPPIEWTQRIPEGWQLLTTVSSGNGLFVAVGLYGEVATSRDGIEWALQHNREPDAFSGGSYGSGVAFGNGVFIATGGASYGSSGSTRILRSTDGKIWTRLELATGNLRGVAFGNGKFVSTSKSAIFSSSDGLQWAMQKQFEDSVVLVNVARVNDLFVVTGAKLVLQPSSHFTMFSATSSDGVSWTESQNSQSDWLYDVAYGNQVYVSIDRRRILRSTNAADWSPTFDTSFDLRSVTFGNGKFIAGGDGLLLSTNGLTWEEQRSPMLTRLTDIHFDNGLFVAVALDGSILTSIDAVNWVQRRPFSTQFRRGVAYGNGTFVATDGDHVFTSGDGQTWARRPVSEGADLRTVTFTKDGFVAGGDGIFLSQNGIEWMKRPGGASSIAYGLGRYAAIDVRQAGIGISTNLLTWNYAVPKLAKPMLNDVAYGNGTFVAVGSFWQHGRIYEERTRPLILTWTNGGWGQQVFDYGVSATLNSVTFGKGRFVVFGGGSSGARGFQLIYSSTDGISWQTNSNADKAVPSSVTCAGGIFVAPAGLDSFFSDDGLNWTSQREKAPFMGRMIFGKRTLVGAGLRGAIYQSNERSAGDYLRLFPRLFGADPDAVYLDVEAPIDATVFLETSTDLKNWTRRNGITNFTALTEIPLSTSTHSSPAYFRGRIGSR